MADSSEFMTLLDTMATQIQGLNLTFNGQAVNVYIRKEPRWWDQVDPNSLPCINVCPHDKPEEVEIFSSDNPLSAGLPIMQVKYVVEVVILAACNKDLTATNLDTWFTWRQQERRLFQTSLQSLLQENFKVDVMPEAPLVRQMLKKNYAASGIGYKLWVVEPAA